MAAFRTLAAELGLAAHVLFPGAMPAAQALPLGRVLVMPSRAESFPYVVLEAGAAGMPMIATDVGGIPEIVAGSDTGLVPPGDVTALARAMAAHLGSPETARAKARRLRALIARRFTVAGMATSIMAFYEAKGASGQRPRLAS